MIPYNIQTNLFKFLQTLVLVFLYGISFAQLPDSIAVTSPSIPNPVPGLQNTENDTIPPGFPVATKVSLNLSSDSLDAPVEYNARDSMIYDIGNEIVYLFGNAEVKYQDLTLKADYIIFDWKDNIATAEGTVDSLGKRVGNPVFEDGTQSFTAQKLRYNFVTEKGKVFDVRTQEGDGYLLSGSTKFLKGNKGEDGTDDVAYSGGVIYTTCNLEEPHFGVYSNKAKIIPNKLIVVGPSNIHIGGVPTPLMLPFGFFPITKGQRSGLIFPRDFESSPTLGFGLRNVGYYFGISDYFDLSLTGDIYTRGSWGVSARSNYSKRYKYRGYFSLGYSNRRFGQKNTPDFSLDRDFLITLTHSQAAQAHPTRTISANMTFGTGSYLSNTDNTAESVLTNTLSSNVSVSKSFPGKPISLSASFSHSQNTRTRIMNINFPIIDFRMNQIFPFQRKKVSGGKERWYEKIGFSYTGRAESRVSIADTLLFTKQLFDDLEYGVEHNLPVSASFKVLKWFNLSPSVRYQERWYLQTLEKEFDPTLVVTVDTIFSSTDPPEVNAINRDTAFGTVVERDIFGFKSQRQISASLSLSTQLFGQMGFGKGRAVRHVVKPSLSFNVTPDYTRDFWGYFDSVRVDTRTLDKEIYSIFDNGIYSVPSRNRQASLSYGIGNSLEAKVRNRKDSIETLKKIKLINSLSIRGSYNFAADSLKASTISISGNTTFFKVVNANMSMVYDPYTVDNTGRRINVTEWKAHRRLARFRSANFTLSTRLNPSNIQNLFRKDDEANTQSGRGGGGLNTLNINYSLRFTNFFENGKDTIKITTNSLTLRGTSISLTKKWRVRIGNIGYDFVNKRVTYPDFGFYRDLHCWEMGLDWQPERRTFSFFIRVKPSSLDFLNIPYRRNSVDPFGF